MPLVSALSLSLTPICFSLQFNISNFTNAQTFAFSRCDFLNYKRNMICHKCNGERPKQEISAEYEERLWESPRER